MIIYLSPPAMPLSTLHSYLELESIPACQLIIVIIRNVKCVWS